MTTKLRPVEKKIKFCFDRWIWWPGHKNQELQHPQTSVLVSRTHYWASSLRVASQRTADELISGFDMRQGGGGLLLFYDEIDWDFKDLETHFYLMSQ